MIWLATIAGGLLAGTGLVLLALAAYQWLGVARDRVAHPPPGRLVDAGGHRLHLWEMGAGAQAVVFDAGLPGTSLGWCHVQPEVARFTRAVSYDRAGMGWSDAGPEPRSTQQIVAELRAALRAAGIPPPYVLVGHSFGGYTARLYAGTYPDEVAGIVMVDAIHPPEFLSPSPELQKQLRAGIRQARRWAWYARLGLVRLYLEMVAQRVISPQVRSDWVAGFQKLPRELLGPIRAFWSCAKPFAAIAAQIESLPASAAQVDAVTSLGDIPLVVIAAGNGPAERRPQHEAAARLSSRGRLVVAERSGHWVQLDDPQLVVSTIREVVEEVRMSGGQEAGRIGK